MNKYVVSLIILVFLLGWVGSNVYSQVYKDNYELRLAEDKTDGHLLVAKERISPSDRIKESQIHVYDNGVVIDIKDPEWSTFTDTNSMDPVIDKGANAIHIVPQTEDDISVGDIVAYEPTDADGTIIHRVIEKGSDEEGLFFILKGDNNPVPDPGRIRFSQIRRVLVAVIY
jgi:hypothetical protein